MSGEQETLFRPRKKQKTFRKRATEDTVDQDGSSTAPKMPTPADAETEETGNGVAEILRRRKLAQKSRGGVEFSSTTTTTSPAISSATEVEAVSHCGAEESAPPAIEAVKRFAPQTGLVPDTLDKHMMAYVDSKMAELREGEKRAAEEHASSQNNPRRPGTNDAPLGLIARGAESHRERQPAGMGKLQEIDLGEEVTRMNAQRTQEATRKLQSGELVEPTDQRFSGRGRRGCKRRTSEDIKRDKIVEDILKESMRKTPLVRLAGADSGYSILITDAVDNIYDRTELQAAETNDDQAADDRIVEQFRRDFMEAVQTRNKRNPPPAPVGKGGKVEERPKGPKLGGSRSARAAMRAMEEAKAKKK
ncbi:hypothetical protein HDK90DRAFT_527880 [Phyllosticta capitalensis]|uniref:Hepatocellular carcinoma-associated antigen 59-domain-containing protein n=1 Tax=Phyllosticta capitalensis TaxID=121624 RepID=A0ABR1YEF2_9PEZI